MYSSPAPRAASSPKRIVLHEAGMLLTVEEAGAVLGRGRSAAYGAVGRREILSIRIGKKLLVPTEKLKALLGVERAPMAL